MTMSLFGAAMAPRRTRKPKTKTKTTRPAATPDTFWEPIGREWNRHFRDTARDRRLLSWAIGTLWAVKLLLMARNQGSLVFEGDPRVWDGFEQMSDQLADQHLAALREEFGADLRLPSRLASEWPYLRLVRQQKIFRWSEPLDPDEELPIEPERLDAAREPAEELSARIIARLSHYRRGEDHEAKTHEMACEIVALLAAAKLALALTGNGTLSAVLEQLAELSAEHDYAGTTIRD